MKILFLSAILIASLAQNMLGQDSVSVTFNVIVPEETPQDEQIFWAGSLNRWDPGNEGSGRSPLEYAKPLTNKNNIRQITMTSAMGDTVHYKFTRGSIFSIEEKPDYTYLEPRTVVFDKIKTIQDTIATWHDLPPESLAERWPRIKLSEIDDLIITYQGISMKYRDSILYAEDLVSRYWGKNLYKKVNSIPSGLTDTVSYFHKVSKAPDNTVLMLAGKKDTVWNVYVDYNNDEHITEDEFAFADDGSMKEPATTGTVYFEVISDGKVIQDSSSIHVKLALDLPSGYSSSARKGIPNLTSGIPSKNRKGVLTSKSNRSEFFVSTPQEIVFKRYFQMLIDRDENDALQIESGSLEVHQYGTVGRSRKYYPFPTFKLAQNYWEVANIDSEGRWIRLRPSIDVETREPIAEGKPSPNWEATTVEGKQISTHSITGKYILLDFWGSWCGPCIEEIPLLKKVYQRFKSQNFEMVGFAYEHKASLKKALEEHQLPWQNVLDDEGKYASKFIVRGYPTHYLIGPDGTMVEMGEALRGEQLMKTLERYLKK